MRLAEAEGSGTVRTGPLLFDTWTLFFRERQAHAIRDTRTVPLESEPGLSTPTWAEKSQKVLLREIAAAAYAAGKRSHSCRNENDGRYISEMPDLTHLSI